MTSGSPATVSLKSKVSPACLNVGQFGFRSSASCRFGFKEITVEKNVLWNDEMNALLLNGGGLCEELCG